MLPKDFLFFDFCYRNSLEIYAIESVSKRNVWIRWLSKDTLPWPDETACSLEIFQFVYGQCLLCVILAIDTYETEFMLLWEAVDLTSPT